MIKLNKYIKLDYRWRFWIGLTALFIIAYYFWAFSRYPQLNQKAIASESLLISEVMTMFPIIDPPPWASYSRRVATSVLNWLNSNRQGMFFGLIFAALIRALFSYIEWPKAKSAFKSVFLGMCFGSPLGVCVNCAAPIFRGSSASKNTQLSLALMFSSPTLNFVVVSMVFTLFPLHIAIFKLAFTLMALFLLIPWATKNAPLSLSDKGPLLSDSSLNLQGEICALPFGHDQSIFLKLGLGLLGVVVDFLVFLREMIIKTVPWMFLAAILGSLVGNFFDLNHLLKGETNFFSLSLATLIGLFLPVPMAFDVALVHGLSMDGSNPSVLMALLCSLGIFSFYSFMIVAKTVNYRLALRLTAGLFTLTMVFAYLVQIVDFVKARRIESHSPVFSQTVDTIPCQSNAKSCLEFAKLFIFQNPPYKLQLGEKSLLQKVENVQLSTYSLLGEKNENLFYFEIAPQKIKEIFEKNDSKDQEPPAITLFATFKNGHGIHRHIFQRFRGTSLHLPKDAEIIDELKLQFGKDQGLPIIFKGPFPVGKLYFFE